MPHKISVPHTASHHTALRRGFMTYMLRAGGIGLAPNVYRELVRLQEGRTKDDGHAKS